MARIIYVADDYVDVGYVKKFEEASGSLLSDNASVAGNGVHTPVSLAQGQAVSGPSSVTGSGIREVTATGNFTPTPSFVGNGTRTVSGSGTVGAHTPETISYSVTNDGAGAYLFDDVSNPTLYLKRGSTYNFNIDASGHPFWIKTTSSTGTTNQYNDGVSNNGIDSGTITFVVPDAAPDTLSSNCQSHGSMAGTFND